MSLARGSRVVRVLDVSLRQTYHCIRPRPILNPRPAHGPRCEFLHQRLSARAFSSTTPACKKAKKNKSSRRDQDEDNGDDDSPTTSKETKNNNTSEEVDDPFDFSALNTGLATATSRLRASLSTLRSGGRFNPTILEELRVQPSKDAKATYPLRDLAQVVPRTGRELHVLVNDAAHVKPVSSAIMGSEHSLTPQPDPSGQNAQLLVVRIPPPTAESRRAVVDSANKAGAVAADAIRNVRGVQQKKLRKLEVEKRARPDDLKKAGKEMEEIVKKAGEGAKKIVEAAVKALDA